MSLVEGLLNSLGIPTGNQLAEALFSAARKNRYDTLRDTGREVPGRAIYRDMGGLRHAWCLLCFVPEGERDGPEGRKILYGREEADVHVRWFLRPLRAELEFGVRWAWWRVLYFRYCLAPYHRFRRYRAAQSWNAEASQGPGGREGVPVRPEHASSTPENTP
jgi:hypothetical protein